MTDFDKELLKDLIRLDISQDDVSETRKILESCGDVAETLANPLVTYDEKKSIITKLFPESLHKFIMNTVKGGAVERIGEILDEYTDFLLEQQGSIRAVVRYVTPLTESQQADLRSFIMNKFMKEDVAIEYRHDPDIIGGFILNAGDIEYDKSYRTSLRLMKESLHSKAAEYTENAGEDKIVSGSMSDIISVLKTEVKDFDVKTGATETGFITRLGDGIARVQGMNSVMYGELVEFETGIRGIVQSLEEKTAGVVLLGDDHGLTEGSSVVRTGKRAGIGVSDELLGRVVDALGSPIDGSWRPSAPRTIFPLSVKLPELSSVNP